METRKTPSGIIGLDTPVKVKIMGNEMEVQSLAACNRKPVMKKISGDTHVNAETGEVIKVQRASEYRGQSPSALRKSLAELRAILITNTQKLKHILLLTLTFADEQESVRQGREYFAAFFELLKSKHVQYGTVHYVCVPEFHADIRRYHLHVVLFFNQSKQDVFIPAPEVSELWGHGDITISQPRCKEHVYSYLTPHVSHNITAKNAKMNEKASRLMQIPAGQKLYTTSRGIPRPQIVRDRFGNVEAQHIQKDDFSFEKELIYPTPLRTETGNTLYHAKQYYTKSPNPAPTTKPPRTPI